MLRVYTWQLHGEGDWSAESKGMVCQDEEPDVLVGGAADDAAEDPPPLPETTTELTTVLAAPPTVPVLLGLASSWYELPFMT